MKIQLISDIHTEFSHYKIKIHKDADVLVLAGDIVCADNILSLRGIFKNIDIPVIYVAGNHEFYTSPDVSHITRKMVLMSIREIASEFENVHFLENESRTIDGVKFVGSTLWSDFNICGDYSLDSDDFAAAVNKHIGDFFCINETINDKFKGVDCRYLCKEAKQYLNLELSQPFLGKTVVVSHFCPHRNSIHPMYEGEHLNPYFITDCSDLIKSPVDVWLHGHTHESMEYDINGVRIYCNPRGYHTSNKHFNGKKLVEV